MGSDSQDDETVRRRVLPRVMELSGRGGLWSPARWNSQEEVSSCPQDDGTFFQEEEFSR